MTKLIITGDDGLIARRIISESDIENVIATSYNNKGDKYYLDLNFPDSFNYEIINEEDNVLHLAYMSSPEECKNDREAAYRVNVKGSVDFIRNCLGRGARVLFASSDVVYGNREEAVDENSDCLPYGEYAQMKYCVENRFRDEKKVKIFRMSYVFSRDDKFTSYLRDCSENGSAAGIYHPLHRSVVYIEDVKSAIINLFDNWEVYESNVYNICGNELLSRLDLANFYKQYVDDKLNILITELGPQFYEARPRMINMKSIYLKNLLGRNQIPINQAMQLEFNG